MEGAVCKGRPFFEMRLGDFAIGTGWNMAFSRTAGAEISGHRHPDRLMISWSLV